MASERCASLSDLPSEVVWCIADALDSLADVVSLGATCMNLWHVCTAVAQRRMHALETGARESMDAFVDEWQRFATDCDDDEAGGDCDPCPFYPDGFNGHDSNADDDDDDDDDREAHEFGIFDADAPPPTDMADNSEAGINAKAVADPRLRFCGSYRLFEAGSMPLEPCTGALDWSLHVDSYECRRFICDACACALASALDDDHHTKWPMARAHMDEPHVWAGEWCGMRANVYVPTPPVVSCRVPAGLGAWIDPDAARCLAEDIRRARLLFDADCGPLEEEEDADSQARNNEDGDSGGDADFIHQTDGAVEDRATSTGHDGGENADDNNNPDAEYHEEVEEHWRNFYDNSDNESNNDDVIAARARRRRKDSEADGCDGSSCEDGNNDHNGGKGGGDDSDRDNGKKRETAKDVDTSAVALSSNASDDQDSSNGMDHVIVFGDESDGAARQDPFKCIFGEDRFDDWPRYDHDNPAPAALVRIYHAPVLLMGNLRAWLPVGMCRETCTRPHRANVSRYVLVCCDPTSPLWGAAMAVRVFTDKWPCIMWLPGADDTRAAIEAYRRRPHARSQKTPMGLREGFVHWLCTARRVPTPMEWEKRRAAAIAARRPVAPLWTGFPRFTC